MVIMLPQTWLDWFSWFIARAQAYVLIDPVKIYLLPGLVLIALFAIEAATQKDWRARYLSRNFVNDSFYYFFYYSGVYQFLIWGWLYKAGSHLFTQYLPGLQLDIVSHLSPTMQIVALIFVFDFFHYWNHRLRHAIPWFWAFHSIHHAQTKMTMMTTFRLHFVDETVFRILMFIPFQILGFSPLLTTWLWVDLIMAWVTGAQHSNLTWSYGPLGRFVISPHFHRIHHASDERLSNRNFGGVFSFWDDLFGTAERKAPCPTEHGLPGNPIPETLTGHLVYPFVAIGRDLRGRAKEAVSAAPAVGSQERTSTSRS
jgi:sterol desaturase/sphingolipid hydroxylase (fatty acid hydroxylase superfamily)